MDFATFAAELLAGRPLGPENVVILSSVDSTNLLARRLVAALEGEGENPTAVLLYAWHQGAGRGRGSNHWVSPAGAGIYATRLVPLAGLDAALLLPPLVAGALCRGLNRFLGGRCGLKWPNDLWVAGKKIGGILIETVSRAGGRGCALIGFGVNHDLRSSELPVPWATALALEIAAPPTLAGLGRVLVEELETALAHPPAKEAVIAEFARLLVHKAGDPLRVRSGDEMVAGRFFGLDSEGHLLLDCNDGRRRFAAGEVLAR